MSNSKPSKTEIKNLDARIESLRAEMTDPYTVKLGAAAVKCVRESLETAEAERARRLTA
jgi:hypothetical protein